MGRPVAVVLLTLICAFGNIAICAGWMPTPDARMACCSDGACPMHRPKSHDEDAAVTQADADRCCTAGEREDSTPSSANVAFSVTILATASPVPVALSAPDYRVGIWRGSPPLASARVSKHVLLSVFLL